MYFTFIGNNLFHHALKHQGINLKNLTNENKSEIEF